VRVDHLRGHGQRYDSFAGPDWIITRAREIFPRTLVDWTPRRSARPNSSARLLFRLPAGWRSAAAAAPLDGNSYRLDQPGNVLDRPRGWIALGKLALDREEIADTMVEIARTPNAEVDPKAVFQFLENTLPALKRLLHAESERLLIVVAPDPMWHGGISGENSFFMHAARPLRTPDRTSPYLHELFHVLQPCRMRDDADWIEEGLAEYYSVELQRRAGALDAAAFSRALGYFQRYGVWNVDLTRQYDNAATNNSAPLVMYVLDQRIQRATAGKARLDDVVTRLAKRGGIVDTVRFRHAVEAVTGKKFTKFFDQHVTRGVPPKLNNAK
jgi:predicted metalloprotease with PDZ domain